MFKRKNVASLIPAIFLALSFSVAFSQVQTVTKLTTANPSLISGSLESGSHLDVNVSGDSSLILKENAAYQLQAEFNNWQPFSEANKTKVTSLKVIVEAKASSADDSWYVSFWDYSENAWSSDWHQLGTGGFETYDIAYTISIATSAAQDYLNESGDLRLRLADGRSSGQGPNDAVQTTLSLDYLAVQISYDNTAPDSLLTFPSNNARFKGGETISLSGTASDGSGSGVAQVQVSTDGGTSWPVASGTAAWSFVWIVPVGEGKYTVLARAIDNVGNIETSFAEADVYVDRTGPNATVLTPESDSWVKGVVSIEAAIDDSLTGKGTIAAAHFAVDTTAMTYAMEPGDGSWGDGSVESVRVSWDTSSVQDGLHTLFVRGVDDLGNLGSWSSGVEVKVDNTPPVISDLYAYSYTATATVGWTTDEPATTRVEYGTTVQNSMLTPEDTALRYNHKVELSDLFLLVKYAYRAKSKDAAGNEAVSEWKIFLAGDPDPHQGNNYAFDTDLCAKCHRSHSSPGSRLSVYSYQKDYCFTCHDVAGSGSINFTQAEFEQPYPHSLHGLDAASYKQCANCHETHLIPTVTSNLLVDPVNTTQLWTIVTNTASPFYDNETTTTAGLYIWCERCHVDSAVTGTWINARRNLEGYVPYAVTVVWQTLKSTVDDSGTTTGAWQYFTKETTGTRYGYNDAAANGHSAHGRATSSSNAASRLQGTWRGGYTATYPAMPCKDCHEHHGSAQPWMIVPTITVGGVTRGSYDMTLREGQKSFCNVCHDPVLRYATDVFPDCSTTQKCTDCHRHGWQF